MRETLLMACILAAACGANAAAQPLAATREDVLAYRDNPLHKACQQIVHAAMCERVVCDYEV